MDSIDTTHDTCSSHSLTEIVALGRTPGVTVDTTPADQSAGWARLVQPADSCLPSVSQELATSEAGSRNEPRGRTPLQGLSPLAGPGGHRASCETAFDNRQRQAALYCLATGEPPTLAELMQLIAFFGFIEPFRQRFEELAKHSDLSTMTVDDWRRVLPACGHYLVRVPNRIFSEHSTELATLSCSSDIRSISLVPSAHRGAAYTRAIAAQVIDLSHVPTAYITPELAALAITVSPQSCVPVPVEYLNEKLCELICLRDSRQFAALPEQLQTFKLALRICTNRRALRAIPPGYRNSTLCEQACRWRAEAIDEFDRHYHTQTAWFWVCKNDGVRYASVPKRWRNDAMRKAACTNTARALALFEKDEITEELCTITVQGRFSSSCWALIPAAFKTFDLYLHACRRNGLMLAYVPFQWRDETMCRTACLSNWLALEWVPKPLRGAVYEAACRGCSRALTRVDPQHIRFELFVLNSLTSEMQDIWELAVAHLHRKDLLRLLQWIALFGSEKQYELLSSTLFCKEIKCDLIDFLLYGSDCAPVTSPPPAALWAASSPLVQVVASPFLHELAFYAYCGQDYTPPHLEKGLALLSYVQTNSPTRFPTAPHTGAPLFQAQHVKQIGRTVQTVTADGIFYYKFQKKGEALATLAREGLIHHYRCQHPAAKEFRLISEMPSDPRFFRLQEQDWEVLPHSLFAMIEISEAQGCRYINVYRYKAAKDYMEYAHRADLGHAADPCSRPESGLLAACHDMGTLTGMGLVPTSSIDAFHDTDSERRWLFLHTLLGYGGDSYPGTFGAWNSDATAYPDFGYGGLRDIGDYEVFGELASFFKARDSRKRHPEAVIQRLAMVEAIGENMIAALLLRSRLRQQWPSYHYRNRQAVEQTGQFVEQALNHFLAGFYQTPVRQWQLRELMAINPEEYRNWRQRCAQEICYWTAAQPHRSTPTRPAFEADCGYDHNDCYAVHIQKTLHPTTSLYPEPPVGKILERVYPHNFHNSRGRLNLGIHNGTFPLLALHSGLVRMGSGILRVWQQSRRPPTTDETAG